YQMNEERTATLQKAGFVHVTGLPTFRPGCGIEGENTIQPARKECGHYDHNNGLTVIVTDDGEVWLGKGGNSFLPTKGMERGCHVPCSNGEQISISCLLARVTDPMWDGGGEWWPVPVFRC
ncbi:MAG: hypothetical protein AAB737_01985, partial [Patescibacteria group bacterium]